MTATEKARGYAQGLTNTQLRDSITFFADKTSDHGNRVIFSILCAEGCKRTGLDPRTVAASGNIVNTLTAAL